MQWKATKAGSKQSASSGSISPKGQMQPSSQSGGPSQGSFLCVAMVLVSLRSRKLMTRSPTIQSETAAPTSIIVPTPLVPTGAPLRS